MKLLMIAMMIGAAYGAGGAECPNDCPVPVPDALACPAGTKATADKSCGGAKCNTMDFTAAKNCCEKDLKSCANLETVDCGADHQKNNKGTCANDCTADDGKVVEKKAGACCEAKPAATCAKCSDGAKVVDTSKKCATHTCTTDEEKALCCMDKPKAADPATCSLDGLQKSGGLDKCGKEKPKVAVTCPSTHVLDTAKKCAGAKCVASDIADGKCCKKDLKQCANLATVDCGADHQKNNKGTCANDCTADDGKVVDKKAGACCEAKPAATCTLCGTDGKVVDTSKKCASHKSCTTEEETGVCCTDAPACSAAGLTVGTGKVVCGKQEVKALTCPPTHVLDTAKKCAGAKCVNSDIADGKCCKKDMKQCANNADKAAKCTGDVEFDGKGKCTKDCADTDFGDKADKACCKAKQESCAVATTACGDDKETDTSKSCAAAKCTADELKGLCCKAKAVSKCNAAKVTCDAGTTLDAKATCTTHTCKDTDKAACCKANEKCAAGKARSEAAKAAALAKNAAKLGGAPAKNAGLALAAMATLIAAAMQM